MRFMRRSVTAAILFMSIKKQMYIDLRTENDSGFAEETAEMLYTLVVQLDTPFAQFCGCEPTSFKHWRFSILILWATLRLRLVPHLRWGIKILFHLLFFFVVFVQATGDIAYTTIVFDDPIHYHFIGCAIYDHDYAIIPPAVCWSSSDTSPGSDTPDSR